MIIESLQVDPAEFERRTGWTIRPEGLCKGDLCVPVPGVLASSSGGQARLDLQVLAGHLRMPLVHDERQRLWCLGPEAGGRVLEGGRVPEVILPDARGREFRLSSLHGMKVLLVAWASW
jgi:hypothetical protein